MSSQMVLEKFLLCERIEKSSDDSVNIIGLSNYCIVNKIPFTRQMAVYLEFSNAIKTSRGYDTSAKATIKVDVVYEDRIIGSWDEVEVNHFDRKQAFVADEFQFEYLGEYNFRLYIDGKITKRELFAVLPTDEYLQKLMKEQEGENNE